MIPNSIFHSILLFLQSLLVDYLITMNMDLTPFAVTVVNWAMKNALDLFLIFLNDIFLIFEINFYLAKAEKYLKFLIKIN
jgi:hypothetical protein